MAAFFFTFPEDVLGLIFQHDASLGTQVMGLMIGFVCSGILELTETHATKLTRHQLFCEANLWTSTTCKLQALVADDLRELTDPASSP